MMVTFIANQIIKAANKSEALGVAKYNAYFVNTRLHLRYKEDVEAILRVDGYGWVFGEEIVNEETSDENTDTE